MDQVLFIDFLFIFCYDVVWCGVVCCVWCDIMRGGVRCGIYRIFSNLY
jgi:hypothetical protein